MKFLERFSDVVKRGFDVCCATIGLLVFAPIVGIVALLVRINLGSPVIFKQLRPGKDEKIFILYKFRSMLDVNEPKGLITNQDRMTSFGRKLRATSLDELPSLLNVLKGEMSIVGPRPLLVSYLDKYTPEQARRHEVRPGITGLAQVNGRNELEWEKRFILDIEYVENRTLLLDLKIILQTISVALGRKGITSTGHVVGSAFSDSNEAGEATNDVKKASH